MLRFGDRERPWCACHSACTVSRRSEISPSYVLRHGRRGRRNALGPKLRTLLLNLAHCALPADSAAPTGTALPSECPKFGTRGEGEDTRGEGERDEERQNPWPGRVMRRRRRRRLPEKEREGIHEGEESLR